MSDTVDWNLRLQDGVSGPAARMAKALAGIEGAMTGADKATAALNQKIRDQGRLNQIKGAASADNKRASLTTKHDAAERSALAKGGGAKAASLDLESTLGYAGAIKDQLMGVYAAVASVVAKVGEIGFAFSKATLSAVAFREGTASALTTLLKSQGRSESAAQVMDVGMKLAMRFSLDPKETIGAMHELISKNFAPDKAATVITAMADLKVLAPKANTDAIVLAMSQIKSKGTLQMEELQGQMAEAGLNIDLVLEQLATKLGKTKDQIRADISAKKITADMGIDAIIASIQKMGGGQLGDVAEKATKSLSGMWNAIQMRPGTFALMIAQSIEGGPGVGAVRAAMGLLVDATNPEKSPGMQRVLASAGTLATTLFTALFGPMQSAGAGDMLQTVLNGAATGIDYITRAIVFAAPLVMAFGSGMLSAFSAAWGVLSKFGDALGKVLGAVGYSTDGDKMVAFFELLGKAVAYAVIGIAAIISVAMIFANVGLAIVGVIASIVSLLFGGLVGAVLAVAGVMMDAGASLKAFATEAYDAGTNFVMGFVNGITGGLGAVVDAARSIGRTAADSVATTLNMHSPSRVMMEMGSFAARGFAMGVEAGAPAAGDAMAAAVSPPVPAVGNGGAGGASGGRGPITVTLGDIHATGGDDPEATGKAIARNVRAELRTLLEELLGEQGFGPEPA